MLLEPRDDWRVAAESSLLSPDPTELVSSEINWRDKSEREKIEREEAERKRREWTVGIDSYRNKDRRFRKARNTLKSRGSKVSKQWTLSGR